MFNFAFLYSTVLCGLAKGNIVAVDLRMGRTAQNYKGFSGAVRDIACHPSEPYIVSVGLDRFLRVHHKTTKQLLVKVCLFVNLGVVVRVESATFMMNFLFYFRNTWFLV